VAAASALSRAAEGRHVRALALAEERGAA